MPSSTYLQLLTTFLQFRSISTDPTFKLEMTNTANWLVQTLRSHGFRSQAITGYDNPIVLAHYITDTSLPTALIYGHYDVQPADQSEGWLADPFSLHQANNRVYARGAIDNKGQVMIHIAAIFELIEQKKLGYNIKFMLEGNEETGSPLLSKFIADHANDLQSDVIVISDGEITGQSPVLELGFRGGFNSTLTIRTADNDVHSGIYGGAMPSAAHELTKLLSQLFNEQNQITVPHFYDDVLPIDGKMHIELDQQELQKITGAKTTLTEPNIDFYNQTGLRPTLQITGISTGYTGEGYRNSIPATATAKINARLVKNQNPQRIAELLKNWIAQNLPDYVSHEFTITDPYEGIKLDVDNQYIQKAAELLEQSYGVPPIYKYSGGGLPVVTTFHEILGKPQVLVPFANEDCAMHGANENFDLAIAKKAYAFSTMFFSQ